MLEIGIPVYKSKDDLPQLLNSLLNQVKKNFIVCLSIDADGEDYREIIKEYHDKGLRIRTIIATTNGGPGVARQRILDTTFADYIMFCDADDMLHPRAVELLYRNAKREELDIIRGTIEVDHREKDSDFEVAGHSHVTHLHATCYKVKYLQDNDIRFQDDLRYNEDTYFNLVAFNCTDNKKYLDMTLYFWHDNKSSITRGCSGQYFMELGGAMFTKALIRGLNKIYKIRGKIDNQVISASLVELYRYFECLKYFQFEYEEDVFEEFQTLKQNPAIQEWINELDSWRYIASNCPCGSMVDNNIIFFKERFVDWFNKYIIPLEDK